MRILPLVLLCAWALLSGCDSKGQGGSAAGGAAMQSQLKPHGEAVPGVSMGAAPIRLADTPPPEVETADAKVGVVVDFGRILEADDRVDLEMRGFESVVYLTGGFYYLYGPAQSVRQLSSEGRIAASATGTQTATGFRYGRLDPEHKASALLRKGVVPSYAVRADAALFRVQVVSGLPLGVVSGELAALGATEIDSSDYGHGLLTFKLAPAKADRLLAHPLVLHADFAPPPNKTFNVDAATRLKVADFKAAYAQRGSGVRVQVVDGGQIRDTHQEFGGRVTVVHTATVGDHATHVAGTIGAAGTVASALGMAPSVSFYSYDFNTDGWATRLTHGYSNHNTRLSNHSYGYASDAYDGIYDATSRSVDAAIRANPALAVFKAAGNGRSGSVYGGISDAGISKNTLTIGAVDKTDAMSSFSDWGPSNDGRIKPDLVATGVSMYSPISTSDTAYGTMSGTSMATPAATGAATLVLQKYEADKGGQLRGDLLKALLINTATDLGTAGPDYSYGFGLINAKAAADAIATHGFYIESLSHGASLTYTFPGGSNQAKLTLAWADYEGTANTAPNLVNNLDINVECGGTTYYPYSLNPASPASAATATGANSRDNVEHVVIANSGAGTCTVTVAGTSVPQGPQSFALVSTHPLTELGDDNDPVIAPIGNLTLDENFPDEIVSITGTDNDNESMTFEVATANGLLSAAIENRVYGGIATTTADIRLTSIASKFGTETVTVTGRSRLKTTTESFTVTINQLSPDAPTGAVATLVDNTSADLNWTDASGNEDGFRLYRGSTLVATVPADTTGYRFTGLAAGTTHQLGVSAFRTVSATLYESARATAGVTTPAAASSGGSGGSTGGGGSSALRPAPVVSITVTLSGDDIVISWSGDWSSDTYFFIYYRGRLVFTTEPGARSAVIRASLLEGGTRSVSSEHITMSRNTTSSGDFSICAANANGNSCQQVPLSPWALAALALALAALGYRLRPIRD